MKTKRGQKFIPTQVSQTHVDTKKQKQKKRNKKTEIKKQKLNLTCSK